MTGRTVPHVLSTAVFVVLAIAHAAWAENDRRIVLASNVRVRAAASSGASIVATLPLGAEVTALEQTSLRGPWSRVRTNDGTEGWVQRRLTTPFDPERRAQIVEPIVVARLPDKPALEGGRARINQDFEARVQLVDLIARTESALTDREAQARFGWYRLRAIEFLLVAVPEIPPRTEFPPEPYQSWLRKYQGEAYYYSPGGLWAMQQWYLHHTFETYRGTAAADEIAWVLAMHSARGECEGDVV